MLNEQQTFAAHEALELHEAINLKTLYDGCYEVRYSGDQGGACQANWTK
ncbi:hypothetical protein [Paenibacillus harenae]|uniref:Uncharacterized protein n=1 Tax=Paenibacillus harenae TaxID=306543 RepID=A0ABT9U2J5_PAEHA|nr:hypothetical protein [Paenibacillus harenae]MDQ0062885.1 hypothetical protein [Paenibacillus harenae]MDQ0113854.1 hypothetical protein [Paenibacillus harenae]